MGKKHILIVDDEADMVELLSFRLHSHDYEVSVAYTGKEGIEKAQGKPNLMLLDVMLPDMSGYEVCDKLRKDKNTHNIPIIMLTARDAPHEKIEGLYIGADDYITKPFEPEELMARIEAILRRTELFGAYKKNRGEAMSEIKNIISEQLVIPHFQPIFYLNPKQLLGVEVLSRLVKSDGYFHNSEMLFDTAFHLGMLSDLEIMCHRKALDALGKLASRMLVFFNMNPYVIHDKNFNRFISLYKNFGKLEKIGLELTERTAIADFGSFVEKVESLKRKGIRISIDDVGSGYASLKSIVEIKPDFIKIDLHLIHNIDHDKVRQNLLKALVMFCRKSGITPIAEGIEKSQELDVLMDYEVDAGQGFYFGKPTPDIKSLIPFMNGSD